MISHFLGLLGLSWLFFSGFLYGQSEDIEFAPQSFQYKDALAVPVDFIHSDLKIIVDYEKKQAVGVATVVFKAHQEGYPLFDLTLAETSAQLNGEDVTVSTISDPDRVTQLRVVNSLVRAGSENRLHLEYDMTKRFTFEDDGIVRAGFFMSDLSTGGRHFWELVAPANFEFDHFEQVLEVQLKGTSRAHIIYTNAEQTKLSAQHWQLRFPGYFTSSSFYFHLTEAGRFYEERTIYQGLEREIPVTVYASTRQLVDSGVSLALSSLKNNEELFGPYAHASVVVYVTPYGGGMEYSGATVTSLGALPHEFRHLWFARSVMPADGNTGWIDEAIASWGDRDFFEAQTGPTGGPINLAGYSPYKRETSMLAYSKGRDLLAQFHHQFIDFSLENQTGMLGVLRGLYGRYRNQTITVGLFQGFMEQLLNTSLAATFERYVYGRGLVGPLDNLVWYKTLEPVVVDGFTAEQLAKLQ